VNSAPEVQNNGYVDAPSKERFTKNVRDLTVLYGLLLATFGASPAELF